MNDEKSEKAGLTISVKIPREKIGLPSCQDPGWIAFVIIVVMLIGAVLGVKFCNWAEIFLMREPLTLKILSYHPMPAIMLCLGFAVILLLLYFVYCRYVLGIARENREAEKDRMDFISHQLDMLKNLVVVPVKRQRTETINVVITHLENRGRGVRVTTEGPNPNGGDDEGSFPYQPERMDSSLSIDIDYKDIEN